MAAFLVGSCQNVILIALIISHIVRNARSTCIPIQTALCSATDVDQGITAISSQDFVNLVTTA